ncbi:Transglycosylase, Slt family [hydrothermal vent metagenome]|uniref:Transglycosylase, Slt family n=1 Tax=hydrothermal vent metagenome TaxID=652676 RepID=A0A3B0VY24_9ZZZZ
MLPLNASFKTVGTYSLVLALILGSNPLAEGELPVQSEKAETSFSERINQPFIGDLGQILERRTLRVLVSYNGTNFFHTIKGMRGLEHDLIKSYEKYLNRGPRKKEYKTHIVFLTRPFNQLFDELLAGRGDLIASGLTVTAERKYIFDFTDPYIKNVQEILVSHQNSPIITRLEDLSNRQIIVVANSSYIIHIEQMNQALGRLGLPGIEIIQADPILEGEDLLEMVNAGLFEYTVIDDHIATIYQHTYSNLKLQKDIIFHHGGEIAWALNKNLPNLKRSLNNFINTYAKPGKFLGNSIFQKYYKNPFWIKTPLSLTALDEIPCLQYYFKKYAEFYEFDWFLIASLAYQESRFQHHLTSKANAKGIMQIKRSTARSKVVNIPSIGNLEDNIHAGVKYLAFLRDHYFDKPEYSKEDQINFSLAAYNAGPGRIRKLQREAEAQGLDPNKWFYHVEKLARQDIGHETVDYVTQIQKRMIGLKSSITLSKSKQQLKKQKINDHKNKFTTLEVQ